MFADWAKAFLSLPELSQPAGALFSDQRLKSKRTNEVFL